MKYKSNTNDKLANANLFRLLQSFSKKEFKEFENFINSPFFNHQSTLIKLFDEIKKFYPQFSGDGFTKEKLYEAVNPGKSYNDIVFRKYISNLMKLAEDYLVVIDNINNRERKVTSLLNQFERRNQFALFRKLINNGKKDYTGKTLISNETFYFNHVIEELKSNCDIRTNNLHLLKPNLIKSHIYLLMHLLLTNTVNSNMMLVNRKSFRDSDSINIIEDFFEKFDIIDYLEKTGHLNEQEKHFVELCRNDIILLRNPFNPSLLRKMKLNILDLSEYIDKNLLYIFFSHLNIYYLINISHGRDEFNIELLDNYKLMIDMGLYFYEGREYINFSEYRTILLQALRLKEFKWALEFILKFKDYHANEMKENIYDFSMAFLNFEEGKFEDSLKYLSKVRMNDVILKLDCEVLMLLIYFELNYTESAKSLVDSFRYFVKSNSILSDEVKHMQYDFIKYYKTILKFRINGMNDYEYDKLKEEISGFKNLRRKSWILEKLDNLLKGNILKSSSKEKFKTAALK